MKKVVDTFDERIVKVLLIDGRISISKLAERVGLSTTPCWNRVKRLTENGTIKGYRAIVDWGEFGRADTVIVQIKLNDHSTESLSNFCSALIMHDWVLNIYITTGLYDVEATVVVNGTAGLNVFLQKNIYCDDRVAGINTMFVIRHYSK